MKHLVFILICCIIVNIGIGQELFSFEELKKRKKYKSLEKALENPAEVYVLILHEQNLAIFPEEILKLPHLQYLSLAGNPIKEIPTNITQLKELQYLHLPLTKIENLAEEVLNMPSLIQLSLVQTPLGNDEEKMEKILEKYPNTSFRAYLGGLETYRQIGIVSSVVFNPTQTFGELGIYWGKLNFLLLSGVSAGVEWNPRTTVYKAGLLLNALASLQLNFLLLDNHQEQTFALRPEIGVGIANVSLTYGPNLFVPKDFEDIVKHVFTFRLAIPVFDKKKKWYRHKITMR